MNDPNWTHISHYSDATLRRMAANPRDLRSESARRELERREAADAKHPDMEADACMCECGYTVGHAQTCRWAPPTAAEGVDHYESLYGA